MEVKTMESVRLKINEYMTSVGEEILCVLDKQQRGADVCCVKLVRVFVLERLSAAAEFMCNLFQREIETLHNTELHTAEHNRERSTVSREIASQTHSTFPEEQRETDQGRGLFDATMQPVVKLYRIDFLHIPVCKEEVSPEEELSPNLVQEEPEPPQIIEEQEELLERPEEAGGSTLTLLAVKSEDDDENRETEPVASTSAEHMKTQADVEDCGTSQPTSDDQLLSSHCSESDTEDSDEWEETRGDQSALNTLESHKTQHVGEQCKLSQDLKSSKQTHSMTSLTGKKSFSCTECGKMFNTKGNLKSHTMIHTGETPFACAVCGKGCARKGDLKKHMMTHTGEKPFACTVCGKDFVQSGHLKKHMMTHTGERPFSCTVCGKGCVQSGDLKTHMMTHTGEKPFACTVCRKGFALKYNLKTHMRTHTG